MDRVACCENCPNVQEERKEAIHTFVTNPTKMIKAYPEAGSDEKFFQCVTLALMCLISETS